MATPATEAPWHAAFPQPVAEVAYITPDEVRATFDAHGIASKELLVVDVRRTDFETGLVAGAINLPAHSLYPTAAALVPLLSSYKKVATYCGSCSAGGRGQRSARWLQDALNAAGVPKTQCEAVVLEGGSKAWLKAYGTDDKYTQAL